MTDNFTRGPQITEADARLIASSPQLLAALREIARIARAAIARATDESQ